MINKILGILKNEPAALVGLGSAIETLLILLGVDKALLAAIAAVLTAGMIVVRLLVTPTVQVASTVHAATSIAAAATAAALSPETVGAVGEVKDEVVAQVSDIAKSAATSALSDLGIGKRAA